MSLFDYIKTNYNQLMGKADPRMDQYILMKNPFPTIIMCLSYVFFVKYVGPKIMAKRKAMDLSTIMITYNIITVIWNAIIAVSGLYYYFIHGASLQCDTLDKHPRYVTHFNAKIGYYYYLLKLMEFSDTIFAVLRKKSNQVSNLHVLHHGILPFSVWLGLKFVPGGHGNFFGWLNSIVHVVMYSYYSLAALGPEVQKHLWWKKYLTQLQLAHFIAIFLHQFQVFFNGCSYPKILSAWIMFHAAMFFILFSDFYRYTYNLEKKKEKCDIDKIHLNGDDKLPRNGLKAE